jgi:hypothetical protein
MKKDMKPQLMYAVYRNDKVKYPSKIFERAAYAQEEVLDNKKYMWGRTSYYKTIYLEFTSDTIWKVSSMKYITSTL